MAQICGYNADGTPYYCPDALGIEVGKEFASSLFSGPGPTPGNLSAAGIPNILASGTTSALGIPFDLGTAGGGGAGGGGFNLGGNSGPLSSFSQGLDSALGGIPGDVAGITGIGGDSGIAGAIKKVAAALEDATKSVGAAASFLTDGPRLLTVIVGILVIAFALFALGVHEIFLSGGEGGEHTRVVPIPA